MHEQCLVRLDVQGVHHGLIGGQSRQGKSGRLGTSHVAGFADEGTHVGGDQFGKPAVGALHIAADVADDFFPHSELRGREAGTFHDPCDVPAGYHREVRLDGAVECPCLQRQIGGVEGCRPYPHQDGVDVRLGFGQLGRFQYLRSAVAAVDHGLHRQFPGTAIGMSMRTRWLTIFHSLPMRRRSVS